jgi:hypothetical protein
MKIWWSLHGRFESQCGTWVPSFWWDRINQGPMSQSVWYVKESSLLINSFICLNLQSCHQKWWQLLDNWKIACAAINKTNKNNPCTLNIGLLISPWEQNILSLMILALPNPQHYNSKSNCIVDASLYHNTLWGSRFRTKSQLNPMLTGTGD